jgi:[ribosomal protein S18]-alanine N-acetyltransferase
VNIRKARQEDHDHLLALIGPFQSTQFNWNKAIFSSEFANTDCWVLECHGEIQSFVCLRDVIEAYELSVLATRKESHGKGYMSSLLLHIQDLFGRQRQLWLEVHESNVPAQKLYTKLGF